MEIENIKKISVNSGKDKKFSTFTIILIIFGLAILFIGYQVIQISNKVSNLKISDDKMEYVYQKVGDLVNVLNTKEDSQLSYNPTETYDFKPTDNEIVPEKPAESDQNKEVLKEEILKMKDSEKLKVIRDKLVDIYQKSKERDDELGRLKQSFYDEKSNIEAWYYDKKNIKAPSSAPNSSGGIVDKLKKNLNSYVKISKVGENLSTGKKVLDIDQIPEMLSYAEILLEAGSLSQVAWILEDIATVTKQEDILTFTAKLEAYVEKHPNPNMEVQQIKELIELIENKE